MILYIVVGLLSAISVALTYIVFNLNRKIKVYEDAVQQFYEDVSIILHTMRNIDERQIFQQDDEVGQTFQDLLEVLGLLRPLIYGVPNSEEEN
jgi:formiminotetrahydrofolate cyclodeaminase